MQKPLQMLKEVHRHPKFNGLSLDLRHDSPFYQARAFINGRQLAKSTKTDDIRTAFRVAESWYRQQLRATPKKHHPLDKLGLDPTVGDVQRAYADALDRTRKAEAQKRWGPIKSFWDTVRLVEIGPKTFREFYRWRRRTTKGITPHSLHKDTIAVRVILKHAIAEEQLESLPMIPSPGRIVPNQRPPLSEPEWQHLLKVSQERIKSAPNARTKQQRIDCDHFCRLLVATAARVEEIYQLRFRDCRLRIAAEDGKPYLLVATVRGKTGVRDIVGEKDAVDVITDRLGKPEALIFPARCRDSLRELLEAAGLRYDSQGRERNSKSLRATAICRLLLAGRDVTWVAKNSGTSLPVISSYYSRYLNAEAFIRDSHPIDYEVSLSEGRE
jgi:integrase